MASADVETDETALSAEILATEKDSVEAGSAPEVDYIDEGMEELVLVD